MDFISIARQAAGHIMHGHLPPRELTSLFISKALGVAILAGACVTKVPQVLAVLREGSVKGLSPLSLELELYCGLIHVAYGVYNKLAITAYGEAAVIWAQNVALLGIVYAWRRDSVLRPAALVTVAALVLTPVALDQVDARLMARAYDLNSTIYLVSKVPQIYLAFREGSTGQLSFATTFLMFFGSLMRVFTSMREAAGPAMVRGFVLGSAVNGTMLFQILYYGAAGRKRVEAKPGAMKKAA